MEPVEELSNNLMHVESVLFNGTNWGEVVDFVGGKANITILPSATKIIVKEIGDPIGVSVYAGEHLAKTEEGKFFVFDPIMYDDDEPMEEIKDPRKSSEDLRTELMN